MHNKHTIYTLTGISFAAFCLALSNTIVSSAHASNLASANASVTVDSTCTMNASVTSEHSATMVNGTYSGTNYPNGIGSTTMQTFCNDANGYAIYAIGYTNNEEGNTVLKGGAGLSSDYDIVTGTATSGSGSSDVSNWAMKVSSVAGTYAPTIVNGFNNFSNIPSSYTTVAKYNGVTDQNTTGSSITTTYAAYISNTQPAGTYTGQVKYVLVHPDFDVPTARTMQNIAEWEDELLPGVQVTTVDSRDGTVYTVAKLSDGLIWMTRNLDLPGGTTLTPADSNVSSDYTLPASSTSGFSDSATAYVYNSGSTTCGNNSPCYSYYSYAAATAGTNPSSGDATSDICPKGWRLPTKAEYNTLKSTYTTGATLTASPWLGVYAGYYDGSFGDGGTSGYYWSSTASTSTGAYYLTFSNSGALVFSGYKRLGVSVRCVREVLPTMQEVTSGNLAEMMPNAGDAATLRDSRDDNIYSVSNIGGQYWMTQNLDLAGGTTLTPADSNVSSNYTLPASSTDGFNDDTKAFVYNSGSTACGDGSPCYSYYSYVAATAGTNPSSENATSDICPKGWRLPTQAEYNNLISTYTTGATLTASPWFGVYAGHYYDGSFGVGGTSGYYWSSTAFSSAHAYRLLFNSSNASVNYGRKKDGHSVRCIKNQ